MGQVPRARVSMKRGVINEHEGGRGSTHQLKQHLPRRSPDHLDQRQRRRRRLKCVCRVLDRYRGPDQTHRQVARCQWGRMLDLLSLDEDDAVGAAAVVSCRSSCLRCHCVHAPAFQTDQTVVGTSAAIVDKRRAASILTLAAAEGALSGGIIRVGVGVVEVIVVVVRVGRRWCGAAIGGGHKHNSERRFRQWFVTYLYSESTSVPPTPSSHHYSCLVYH
jgi:hypothetical protein